MERSQIDRRVRRTPRSRGALLLSVLLGLSACEEGGATTDAAVGDAPARPVAAPAKDAPVDGRVLEARRALETGLTEVVWTITSQLGDSIGIEGPLLKARAALLEGDAAGALRHVEAARAWDAEDPRMLAVEVEVLVVLDRLASAQEKLRAAYQVAGRTADLERARGILLIRQPGGGRLGLTALELARQLDPELPFLDYPTAQAHLLVGREALSASAPDQALAHALLARDLDPYTPDYRELEAEAHVALGEFAEGIAIYEELEAGGRDFGATLAILRQRYGTALLILRDRDGALEQYRLARAAGLDDEGLGHGATMLAEEATRLLDIAYDAYDTGDLARASKYVDRVFEIDPEHVDAWNLRGVVRFREGEHRSAAEAWEVVLALAERDGIALPEPVHTNLARAWRLAGELEKARLVLSEYLDAHPDGAWRDETQAMLAVLEAEIAGAGTSGTPSSEDSGG